MASAAAGSFTPYGPSHWAVLAVFVLGSVLLVGWGRRHGRGAAGRLGRVLAVLTLLLAVVVQVYSMASSGWNIDRSVPLHLSDLAPPIAAYALWSHKPWAYSLTYYWCLTLSSQALVSPVLTGPDFPHYGFLAFWSLHLLVVWAAIYLTWGLRLRPDWRSYRLAVVVTLAWVGVAMAFNSLTGTNYGYLNGKPDRESILDALGPWPWYVLVEIGLVLVAWALMTWPWTWSPSAPAGGRRAGRPHLRHSR